MATQTIWLTHAGGVTRSDGSHPQIKFYQEANSQTFVAGDLVYRSSGLLTVCGADPAAILGIALAPATNVTSSHTMIPVLVLDTDTEVVMNVYHSTASSATFANNSGHGGEYGIAQNAAGKWCVDLEDTSNTRVKVNSYVDDKGDIYMKVKVKFMPASLQDHTYAG